MKSTVVFSIKRLSTCDCDGADIVFDSKYVSLTKSTMTLLTKLVKSKNKSFTAQITNTIKQSGSSDCGFFCCYIQALHFDTTLVHLSMINVE